MSLLSYGPRHHCILPTLYNGLQVWIMSISHLGRRDMAMAFLPSTLT